MGQFCLNQYSLNNRAHYERIRPRFNELNSGPSINLDLVSNCTKPYSSRCKKIKSIFLISIKLGEERLDSFLLDFSKCLRVLPLSPLSLRSIHSNFKSKTLL